jgi:hypothetical protein
MVVTADCVYILHTLPPTHSIQKKKGENRGMMGLLIFNVELNHFQVIIPKDGVNSMIEKAVHQSCWAVRVFLSSGQSPFNDHPYSECSLFQLQ